MLMLIGYVSLEVPRGWAYGSWQHYQGNLDYTGRQALRGDLSVGRFVVESEQFLTGLSRLSWIPVLQPAILPFQQTSFIVACCASFVYSPAGITLINTFGTQAMYITVANWEGLNVITYSHIRSLFGRPYSGETFSLHIDTLTGNVNNGQSVAGGAGKYHLPPTVDDINNDGLLEIVYGINDNICAYRPEGCVWEVSVGKFPISHYSSSDIDNDGIKEIIFLETWPEGFRKLVVLNGMDGSLEWRASENIYDTYPLVDPAIMTEDINNDGYKEVIVIRDKVYAYSHDGSLLWEKDLGYQAINNGAVGDIDKDGIVEVLVQMGYHIYALDGRNGDIKWSRFLGYDIPAVGTGVKIADIDPTPGYEVLVPLEKGIKVIDAEGNILWEHPVSLFLHGFSVGDADGDGCSEVVGVESVSDGGWSRVFVIDALSNSGGCGLSTDVKEVVKKEIDVDEGEIYDISGRLIKVGDVRGLKRGIYFIKGKGGVRKVEVR